MQKKTSLRAAALFEANVSEKLILERLRYHWVEALRQYERSSSLQHWTSKVLATNTRLDYQEAVQPTQTAATANLPIPPVMLNIESLFG